MGKQRVEAWQIYNTLIKIKIRDASFINQICAQQVAKIPISPKVDKIPWENHPAVKMWKWYEVALLYYGIEMCVEWIRRGYKDTLLKRFNDELRLAKDVNNVKYPKWLGNKDFHNAMRSNLLRKDYEYYKQFNWNVPNDLEYIWG